MGNRDKNSPSKKPTSTNIDLPNQVSVKKKLGSGSTSTSVGGVTEESLNTQNKGLGNNKKESIRPGKAKQTTTEVRVFISPECKRLAEQALQGTCARRARRSSKTKQKQSPSTHVKRNIRRRKALVQALKNLRNHPKKVKDLKSNEKRSTCRFVLRSNISSTRKLRPRNRKAFKTIEGENDIKPRLRHSPRKSKDKMETPTTSTIQSDKNVTDSPEHSTVSNPENQHSEIIETEADEKEDDMDSETSSDDVQLPILDKAVPLEKDTEEESDEDDSTNLPDDSDYESSLLSPSALPASSLFKFPKNKDEKEKSVSPVHATSSKNSSSPSKMSVKSSTSKKSVSVLNRKETSASNLPMSYTLSSTISFGGSSSYFRQSPPSSSNSSPEKEKRGRGRPRKPLEDVKSITGKIYRDRLEKIAAASKNPGSSLQFDYHEDANPTSSAYLSSMSNYESSSADSSPEKTKLLSKSPPSDQLSYRKRLGHRWKDRSTFVYAKHKFSKETANKFRCETCDVYFTALSSLKRHYGTIYHKQQLGLGVAQSSSAAGFAPQSSSSQSRRVGPGAAGKRFGSGVPPRTSSFIRKNAASNIKKYYAAADAARRFKAAGKVTTSSSNGGGGNSYSNWLQQKQHRKRKPLQHSDYLYPSSSADSEGEDDGVEGHRRRLSFSMDGIGDDDIENNYPGRGYGNEDDDLLNNGLGPDKNEEQKSWLSSVWKGTGSPHFTCEVCSQTFERKMDFTKHLFVHRQEEEKVQSMTCPDCQTSFPTDEVLGNHFKLFKHGPEGNESGERRMKRFVCIKCNSAFSQRNYYIIHLESHKRPLIRCPHCPSEFIFKFYLSDHIKEEHDGWSYNNGNNSGPIVGSGANSTVLTPISNAVSTPNTTTGSGVGTKSGKKIELYSSTTTFLPVERNGKGKRKSSAASDDGGGKRKFGSRGKSSTESRGQNAKNIFDFPSSGTNPYDFDEIKITPSTSSEVADSFRECGSRSLNEADTSKAAERPEEKPRVGLSEKLSEKRKRQKDSEILETNKDVEIEKDNEANTNKKERKVSWRSDDGDLSLSSSSVVGNSISKVEHSISAGGKIVFQFAEMPLSSGNSLFDLNLKGSGTLQDVSSVSPLTIEIPRDNINLEEKDPLAEEEPSTSEAGMEKGDDEFILGDVHDEDPLSTDSVPSSLAKATDSEMNMPLIGCGVKWHLHSKPEENGLTCQDCGKVFEHRKSLVKHVHYFRQSEDYPCKLCNKTFKLKHHVSRHMKSFHNVDTSSTTSSTTSEDPADTDPLGSPTGVGTSGLLPIPPVLAEGSRSRTASTGEEKDKVPQPSSSSASTARSMSAKRGKGTASKPVRPYTIVLDDNRKAIYKCLVCFKLYPTKPQLNSHLWYHNKKNAAAGREKFPCDICPDKSFTWRKDLLRHKREKHGIYSKRPPPTDSNSGASGGEVSKRCQSQPQPQPSPKRCTHCPMVFPGEMDLNEHIAKEHKEVHRKYKQESAEVAERKYKQEHSEAVKKFKPDDEVEDDDRPPTPSPHTSPVFLSVRKDDPDEEDDDDDDDDMEDEEPESPEFELLELN